MTHYFQFISMGRTLWLTFAATVLFAAVIFPYLAGGLESLDTRMQGYDHAEVLAALEGYGAEGRARYVWISLILDTIFPIVYCSFYAGLIYRFAPMERLKLLAYLPVLGGVVDLGENLQIVAMLVQFPDISVAQVEWANRFTLTKFAISRWSVALAALALFYGVGKWAYEKRKGEAV